MQRLYNDGNASTKVNKTASTAEQSHRTLVKSDLPQIADTVKQEPLEVANHLKICLFPFSNKQNPFELPLVSMTLSTIARRPWVCFQ